MRLTTLSAAAAALLALAGCEGMGMGGGTDGSGSPQSALGQPTGTEIDAQNSEAPGGTDGTQQGAAGEAAQ